MSAQTKEQTGNHKTKTPGSKKAANFVIQGSILAITGIVVRLIGMFYRIPLSNIIGKQGKKLKGIGKSARMEIEALLGTKVYLETWVKVKENWRDSDFALSNFGYRE